MKLADFIAPGNSRARMGIERQIVQALLATLNRRYSNSVKGIVTEYSMAQDRMRAAIIFKNGYVVNYPLDEINSLECQGMCVMVYDLPPKEFDRGRNP